MFRFQFPVKLKFFSLNINGVSYRGYVKINFIINIVFKVLEKFQIFPYFFLSSLLNVSFRSESKIKKDLEKNMLKTEHMVLPCRYLLFLVTG